ncbi:MAG TPA: polysaccharide deacetylase family protein [Mariniphaga sp.]|nr:polysaccharide deacetylase family protein [Mariniphaga sp.]
MNRTLLRRLFYIFSKPYSIRQLQKLSKQNFIFPFYHIVSDHPSPLVKHLYPVVSIDRFNTDLDFLLKHYEPATFEEVLTFAHSKSYNGNPRFFLTFDDGFAECYSVIMPILRERGLQAAFFVNPAFVDNRQLSHRQKVSLLMESVINNIEPRMAGEAGKLLGMMNVSRQNVLEALRCLTIADNELIDKLAEIYRVKFNEALQIYKPYMSADQLRSLMVEGFTVGSHSYNHPEFNVLSEPDMKKQIHRSFDFLEKETGIKERIFSFPFHDIGVPLSFFHFLQKEAGVKVSFGTSGMKLDNAPGHLHRIPMEVKGLSGAEFILKMEYFYYLSKSLVHKNTIKRR